VTHGTGAGTREGVRGRSWWANRGRDTRGRRRGQGASTKESYVAMRTFHATGRAGTDTLGPSNYLAARVAAISVSITIPSCSDVIMCTTMKRDSCATVAHCTGCSAVLPHCATICVTASHQCSHIGRQCLHATVRPESHCRTVSRATMFPVTMAHATMAHATVCHATVPTVSHATVSTVSHATVSTVSHATVSTVSHATVSLRDSVSLRDAQSPNDHATRDLVLHCSSRKVAATKGKGT